jgi:hypothetical protein
VCLVLINLHSVSQPSRKRWWRVAVIYPVVVHTLSSELVINFRMPPERPLPKFEVFVSSDDSSHVSPALEIRSNPGHVPTISGTDVPGFTVGDDRRYDISERDASLSRRRPPLSRNSTEEEPLSTSIGTRTITDSLSDASHEEIGQKIHRSRTEAVGESNSS